MDTENTDISPFRPWTEGAPKRLRHITEMTVDELEEYEKKNGINPAPNVRQNRRNNREEIDARAKEIHRAMEAKHGPSQEIA